MPKMWNSDFCVPGVTEAGLSSMPFFTLRLLEFLLSSPATGDHPCLIFIETVFCTGHLKTHKVWSLRREREHLHRKKSQLY